jgi:hypothetical protein
MLVKVAGARAGEIGLFSFAAPPPHAKKEGCSFPTASCIYELVHPDSAAPDEQQTLAGLFAACHA